MREKGKANKSNRIAYFPSHLELHFPWPFLLAISVPFALFISGVKEGCKTDIKSGIQQFHGNLRLIALIFPFVH